MNRLDRKLASRFRTSDDGGIVVMFALTMIVVIGSVGCALDYSRASNLRAKLQSAIDSASVGSVSIASPAYAAAGTMIEDGDIAAGVSDARNLFSANMAGWPEITDDMLTAKVRKTGTQITAALSFRADVPTTFLNVFGYKSITVAGTASAQATTATYIDFYLLLDNSPSMGLAATTADIAKMKLVTPDKCAFACHEPKANSNYVIAKKNNIQTRIDVMRLATGKLMDTATATQTYPGQFRMAIYDFGADIWTTAPRRLFALSSGLAAAKSAADQIDLMTTKKLYENQNRGSIFTASFVFLNTEIKGTPGKGTASEPFKYVLFVSDGVAHEYNPPVCVALPLVESGSCISPINPALCKTLKDRNIKVATLYTTYLDLTPDWAYGNFIAKFNKGTLAPSPDSQIAKNMEACASPGLYFEVGPNQGIGEAMTALFHKAVADARLSG